MNEISKYTDKMFEDIKHVDENGNEYWEARELMPLLEYAKWENFHKVINKAVESYRISNDDNDYWLPELRKPIKNGKGREEFVIDYKLSRYICYLIVQNANPKKKMVALGQTYFAIQTRKQELSEQDYNNLSEDDKRLYQRDLTKKGNLSLNMVARDAGVKNFGVFHNYGYRGLYNGESADDIAKRKGVRYKEEILDKMSSEELIDNLFRITHTQQKLIRDNVQGEMEANQVHYEVGREVRNAIKRLGGTMPEDLPTPEKNLKEIERMKNNDCLISNEMEEK